MGVISRENCLRLQSSGICHGANLALDTILRFPIPNFYYFKFIDTNTKLMQLVQDSNNDSRDKGCTGAIGPPM